MLNYFIFDGVLRRAKTLDHPRASIKITNKLVMVSALADTGAQSNEMDGKKSNMLVIGKNDSLSISITTWAANKISKIISKLLLVKCLQ